MSSKMSSASKNTAATMKKSFCKVCFDAGKDSAHPLRNAAGQTLCPYLLSLICKNCYKRGHTVKYCKEPKRFNAPSAERTPRQTQEKPKQKTPFEMLGQLISEEEKQEVAREREDLERDRQETLRQTNFPQLSAIRFSRSAMSSVRANSKEMSDSILSGWSTVARKTVKVYETLPEEETQKSAEPILVEDEDEEDKDEYEEKDEEENIPPAEQDRPSYCTSYSSWADYE